MSKAFLEPPSIEPCSGIGFTPRSDEERCSLSVSCVGSWDEVMCDVDVESLCELVGDAAQAEQPWVAEEASSRLVLLGWEPAGSVSLPFPRRLAKGDLGLGIGGDGKELVIEVALKEWPADSDSAENVRAMHGDYEATISECQLVEERIIGRLGRRYEIAPTGQVLDRDDYALVHSRSWRVSDIHVTLRVEHLDPDDTPICISLYVSQRDADR